MNIPFLVSIEGQTDPDVCIPNESAVSRMAINPLGPSQHSIQ